MKLFKKLSIIILITSLLMTIPVIFTNLSTSSVVQAASIKMNSTKKTIKIGDKYTLKITGTSEKIKWTSNNKKVATVNSKGKVTAKKSGKVTITGKVGSKKYRCQVKVVDKPTINKTKKTIEIGKKCTLKITGTAKKVTWKSSNKKIATVNSNGKVTAKKVGTATITAKVGKKKLTCKITVKKASVLKVGNHTLKYGKYVDTIKDSVYGGTYIINKDGTFTWKSNWTNVYGTKYTNTGSGKYKVYYSKGDDYDPTSCWVIRFDFKKYHSTYEPSNDYPLEYYVYDVTKDNKFQERQGVNSFIYKGNQ